MAKKYKGIAGGVDINTETIAGGTNYGVGFGQGDLRRAYSEGYSATSILDYLNTWKNPVGPAVRSQLEGQRAFESAQAQIEQQEKSFNLVQAQMQEQQKASQMQIQEQQRAYDLLQAQMKEQSLASQMQIQEQRRMAEEQMRQQQRRMQISAANQNMAGSGQVQFSRPEADRKKLTSAGTSGYFGRQGLRIKGLNVAPAASLTTSTAGSFA